MSISIEEAVRIQIHKIASVFSTSVTEKKDGTAFGFFAPLGLCLIGYTEWYVDDGSFDLRWRVFLGEVTPSLDPYSILKENHRLPDTPFGIVLLNQRLVLTMTDNYRFLVSWGPERIQRVMDLRFGCGAFAYEFIVPGIEPLSEQFFQQALQNYGFDALLSRATVQGWKK